MPERVPSDHDAVDSHRLHVETVGATSRPRVPLPEAVDLAEGDVIRLSIEGDVSHAQVASTLSGTLALAGAYDNARLAREADEGTDHLREWLDDHGIGGGDPLLLDVVTPGYAYGLRRPGDRVVYAAVEPPSDSLSGIARDLEG